ncbi:MAG: FtsH protease activity modulator HflK [Desulfobacteraceae bacterium]|nr:MAG: FtsH protease activity modulator HflK [Desulfobacteraceae bacterium]
MAWDWEKLNQQHRSGQPPQMDEILKQFKNMKIPGGMILVAAFIVVAAVAYSSFFTINTGSVGVVQRFGEFVRIAQPGLNFKLPFGVEHVSKIPQEKIFHEEFGLPDRSEAHQAAVQIGEDVGMSLMLTGDLNVAVVPWIVQYKVKDPYNFLFKVKDVRGLLRDLSEASMRLVVGDRSINEVITKRQEIADEAKLVLQTELDEAESGIQVVTIELKRTNVPTPVQSSFNEVNQAIQEKEKLIYQAKEDYNKAIPSARGLAERTIKGSEGYALDRINRAQGDASRFNSLYAEYTKSKDVTKRRLYLEAIKELLPKLGPKYIVDSDQKNLLPLLNFGREQQQGTEK